MDKILSHTARKGLSPEIPFISEVAIAFNNGVVKAHAVHLADMRGFKTLTASGSVARYYRDRLATRKSHKELKKDKASGIDGVSYNLK